MVVGRSSCNADLYFASVLTGGRWMRKWGGGGWVVRYVFVLTPFSARRWYRGMKMVLGIV